MPAVTATVDAADTIRRFTSIARECPREMDQAIGRAASIILRKIKAFTSKGHSPEVPAVAPRSPLSALLRGPQLFGRLSRQKLFRIVRTGQFSRGVTPYDWASRFVQHVQDGRTLPTSNPLRHALYTLAAGKGRKDLFPVIHANAPAPSRPFVPGIAANADKEFPRWIEGALQKIMANNLRRG